MDMEQLAAQIPRWVQLPAATPEPVLLCQCAVARNLSDFVFPDCCIDDERRAILSRVSALLQANTAIPPGKCLAIDELNSVSVRFLAERKLITYEMLCAVGPRGVYVSDDQSMTIMINASDHIVIRALAATGQCDEVWRSANAVDDALGNMLDFSFHERLGYLTKSLRMTGGGLKVSILLHLPGLVMTRAIHELEQRLQKQRIQLRGVMLGDPRISTTAAQDALPGMAPGLTADMEPALCQCLYTDMLDSLSVAAANSAGNLFTLANQDTLGLSEEEILFHAAQTLKDIIEQENRARTLLFREQKNMLLDSIGRALGIAGAARQLGLGEALQLASLIRLADSQDAMAGLDRTALNRTLLECQSAHLQTMRRIPADTQALAIERANLFRALFSGATIN